MISHTFDAKSTYVVEVVAVQMGIHTEQPPEDGTNGVFKILGEWNTWTSKAK